MPALARFLPENQRINTFAAEPKRCRYEEAGNHSHPLPGHNLVCYGMHKGLVVIWNITIPFDERSGLVALHSPHAYPGWCRRTSDCLLPCCGPQVGNKNLKHVVAGVSIRDISLVAPLHCPKQTVRVFRQPDGLA